MFSLAVILELLASRYGLMPPVTAVCACCMAMRTGGWRVLLPSLAAAAFTDALWGHAFPSRSCAALFAILLASAWRRYGDVNTWGGMVLTVPAVGLVSWCGSMLASPLAGTPFVGW
ncbi:MAG: hypothetical protein J6S21_00475, partial [Victivallales bacterium]|nr:hypothetical protein [Victivallales bacterium]